MKCNEDLLNIEWYSDYLLVQDVLNGSTQIWDRLYCDTYSYVFRYVKRIHNRWLISYDEIYDVVNEAFKRCYERLHTFNGTSKFSTWVCGYCRYILLGYYHKRRLKYKYLIDISNICKSFEACSNPEEFVIKKERNLCLWSAFYSLDYKHQLLIRCYVLKEIKPKRVKEITHLNIKDRKNELIVAKDTLRKRFLALYNSNTMHSRFIN